LVQQQLVMTFEQQYTDALVQAAVGDACMENAEEQYSSRQAGVGSEAEQKLVQHLLGGSKRGGGEYGGRAVDTIDEVFGQILLCAAVKSTKSTPESSESESDPSVSLARTNDCEDGANTLLQGVQQLVAAFVQEHSSDTEMDHVCEALRTVASVVHPTAPLCATVHGRLNGSNIIVDTQSNVVWLVDFAAAGHGPVLTDIAAFECCLLVEYTPIPIHATEIPLVTATDIRVEDTDWQRLVNANQVTSMSLGALIDRMGEGVSGASIRNISHRITTTFEAQESAVHDGATIMAALVRHSDIRSRLPLVGLTTERFRLAFDYIRRVRTFASRYVLSVAARDGIGVDAACRSSAVDLRLLLLRQCIQLFNHAEGMAIHQRNVAYAYAMLLARSLPVEEHGDEAASSKVDCKPMSSLGVEALTNSQGPCYHHCRIYNDAVTRVIHAESATSRDAGDMQVDEDGGEEVEEKLSESQYLQQARLYGNYIEVRFKHIVDPLTTERYDVINQCINLSVVKGAKKQELFQQQRLADDILDAEIWRQRLGGSASAGCSGAGGGSSSKDGAEAEFGVGTGGDSMHDRADRMLFADGSQFVMLLGAAASGKSTLAKRIMVEQVIFKTSEVPILIYLAVLGRLMETHKWSATDDLLGLFLAHRHGRHSNRHRFLTQALAQGRGILILDGLDEAGGCRSAFEKYVVQNLMRRKPGVRVLITSRHSGFKESAFQEFKLAQLLPLNTKLQREMAAKRLPTGLHKKFVEQLRTPVWSDMARSPLMLSLLITHFEQCGGVGEQLNRVRLYHTAIKTMSGGLEAAKLRSRGAMPNEAGRIDETICMLELIALHIHTKRTRDFSAMDLVAIDDGTLEDLASIWNSLVAQVARGSCPMITMVEADVFDDTRSLFRFSHLTFQEYLSAQLLARRMTATAQSATASNEEAFDEAVQRILARNDSGTAGSTSRPSTILFDYWWRQVILLMAGCLDEQVFTQFSAHLLRHDDVTAANASLLVCMLDERGVQLHTIPPDMHPFSALKAALQQVRPLDVYAAACAHESEELRRHAVMEISRFGVDRRPIVSRICEAANAKMDANRYQESEQANVLQSLRLLAGAQGAPQLAEAQCQQLADTIVRMLRWGTERQSGMGKVVLKLIQNWKMEGHPAIAAHLISCITQNGGNKRQLAIELRRCISLRVSSLAVSVCAARLLHHSELHRHIFKLYKQQSSCPLILRLILLKLIEHPVLNSTQASATQVRRSLACISLLPTVTSFFFNFQNGLDSVEKGVRQAKSMLTRLHLSAFGSVVSGLRAMDIMNLAQTCQGMRVELHRGTVWKHILQTICIRYLSSAHPKLKVVALRSSLQTSQQLLHGAAQGASMAPLLLEAVGSENEEVARLSFDAIIKIHRSSPLQDRQQLLAFFAMAFMATKSRSLRVSKSALPAALALGARAEQHALVDALVEMLSSKNPADVRTKALHLCQSVHAVCQAANREQLDALHKGVFACARSEDTAAVAYLTISAVGDQLIVDNTQRLQWICAAVPLATDSSIGLALKLVRKHPQCFTDQVADLFLTSLARCGAATVEHVWALLAASSVEKGVRGMQIWLERSDDAGHGAAAKGLRDAQDDPQLLAALKRTICFERCTTLGQLREAFHVMVSIKPVVAQEFGPLVVEALEYCVRNDDGDVLKPALEVVRKFRHFYLHASSFKERVCELLEEIFRLRGASFDPERCIALSLLFASGGTKDRAAALLLDLWQPAELDEEESEADDAEDDSDEEIEVGPSRYAAIVMTLKLASKGAEKKGGSIGHFIREDSRLVASAVNLSTFHRNEKVRLAAQRCIGDMHHGGAICITSNAVQSAQEQFVEQTKKALQSQEDNEEQWAKAVVGALKLVAEQPPAQRELHGAHVRTFFDQNLDLDALARRFEHEAALKEPTAPSSSPHRNSHRNLLAGALSLVRSARSAAGSLIRRGSGGNDHFRRTSGTLTEFELDLVCSFVRIGEWNAASIEAVVRMLHVSSSSAAAAPLLPASVATADTHGASSRTIVRRLRAALEAKEHLSAKEISTAIDNMGADVIVDGTDVFVDADSTGDPTGNGTGGNMNIDSTDSTGSTGERRTGENQRKLVGMSTSAWWFQAMLRHVRQRRQQEPGWQLSPEHVQQLWQQSEAGGGEHSLEAVFMCKELRVGAFEAGAGEGEDEHAYGAGADMGTRLYAWGDGRFTGHGTLGSLVRQPTPVLPRVAISTVVCSNLFTLALSDEGLVYQWGRVPPGSRSMLTPTLIPADTLRDVSTIAATCPGYTHEGRRGWQAHACAISNGRLYTWGNGVFGQLCSGAQDAIEEPTPAAALEELRSSPQYPGLVCVDVACGRRFTIVQTEHRCTDSGSSGSGAGRSSDAPTDMVGSYEADTTVTCVWLFGEFLGTRHVRRHEVRALRGKSNLTQIVCGGFHCCVLDTDGDLYTWGSATGDDQSNGDLLGHGTGADVSTPTVVQVLHQHGPVVHVAAASYQTSAVTAAGELFTWGDCDGNALGHGPQFTTDVPRQVDALRANPVLRASCGYTNEGVLTRNGELFLWGGGDVGNASRAKG
jgi:alpha-tubulin suppressor-like RCC1 family protein